MPIDDIPGVLEDKVEELMRLGAGLIVGVTGGVKSPV